jgi:hypothetical protein
VVLSILQGHRGFKEVNFGKFQWVLVEGSANATSERQDMRDLLNLEFPGI